MLRVEFRALNAPPGASKTKSGTTPNLDVLAKLANLDALASKVSWKLTKFDAELSRKRTHGLGAFDGAGNLIGYVIYDVAADASICVVRIAVAPDHQRKGIGSRLMDHLVRLVRMMNSPSGDANLYLEVPETNEPAWGFFRRYSGRCGLKAKTHLVKGDPDDYYGFTFLLKEHMACA